MRSFCRNAAIAPNLVLAIFLIAAQSTVSAHVFEHDTGNPQNQVCTTCVAASQLGSATVDSGATHNVPAVEFELGDRVVYEFRSVHTLVARQRGPPSLL